MREKEREEKRKLKDERARIDSNIKALQEKLKKKRDQYKKKMETQISEITEILEDKEVTRNSQRNHP